MTFKLNYFLIALLLFLVEVLIALFLKDLFIRPFLGDFIVVIFLYCLVKSFWNASSSTIALLVLAFSFLTEIGQYFGLVDLLGLGDYQLARIVIGTVFSWLDLLAYSLGILFVYLLDTRKV